MNRTTTRLLLLLVLVGPGACIGMAQDQNSVASNALSTTSLTGTQFNLTSGFRLEMRVTNVAATDAARRTFQDWTPAAGGRLRIRIDPGLSYILTEGILDGNSFQTFTYYGSNTDFIIRVDWIRTTILGSLRVVMRTTLFTPTGAVIERKMNSPDAATVQASVDMRGGTMVLGANVSLTEPCQCRIAWARMWDSPGTETTIPSNNLESGNLYDWEFPTTLIDEIGPYTLTSSGAATYTDTPLAVGLPITSLSYRAGLPITIDASPIAASSYTWSIGTVQAGNPNPVIRGSGSSITLWGTGQGRYNLNLSVIDSKGRTGTGTLAIGTVVTNPSGILYQPTDTIDLQARRFILGAPIPRKGLTSWDRITGYSPPTYRVVGALYPSFWANDYETFLGGTVSVTNGNATVTGTGTSFTTNFLCTGSDDYIVIRYTGGTGDLVWTPAAVQSCGGATSITLTTPWTGPTVAGLSYLRWNEAILTRWTEGINYYDAALVQYQNWYLTGQQTDLDNARRLASDWWRSYLISSGNTVESISGFRIDPRRVSLGGLMMWALDLDTPTALGGLGDSTLAARVRTWCQKHAVLAWEIYIDLYLPAVRPTDVGQRVREPAYTTYHAGIMSLAAPFWTGTVNTSGSAVTWVSGNDFNSLMAGNQIVINGVTYTISSVGSSTALTLTGGAGVQAGVPYSFNNQAMWTAKLNSVAYSQWWRPWQCHTGNTSPRCSDSWSIGAWRATDPSFFAGNADQPWLDGLTHELAFWRARNLLPGFTDTTTLDTIIGDSRTLLSNGPAITNGGTPPPYIWRATGGSTGFAGRPCNSYQYWSFATPSGLNTDANGNSTFAPCGTTASDLQGLYTYSNECVPAAWTYADSGSASDLTRYQEVMGSAWGGYYGPQAYGIAGLGMSLPTLSQSWGSIGSFDNVSLKQQGQSRAVAPCSGLGARDATTSTDKSVVYSFVLGSATSLEWQTGFGASGICLSSPCTVTIKARLGGTLFKADWKLSGSTIRSTGWTTIKSPE